MRAVAARGTRIPENLARLLTRGVRPTLADLTGDQQPAGNRKQEDLDSEGNCDREVRVHRRDPGHTSDDEVT